VELKTGKVYRIIHSGKRSARLWGDGALSVGGWEGKRDLPVGTELRFVGIKPGDWGPDEPVFEDVATGQKGYFSPSYGIGDHRGMPGMPLKGWLSENKVKSNYQCGAFLTQELFFERKALIQKHAKNRKSLSLLFESSQKRLILEEKIELIQLNEVLHPFYLAYRSTKNDLYSRIVKKTIAELKESGLIESESPLLTEGFWDSVQAGIGSFAGGIDNILKKIKLKKEPKGWEEAQRIFAKISEKEGHDTVKDLVKAIEQETQELETGLGSKEKDRKFPVNKHANVFFSGVNTIASTYDSIVAATQKKSGQDGYLPPEVANDIIEQLRIVVQKYMADTEREKGGMYASFGGGDRIEGDIDPDAHGMSSEMVESKNLNLNLLLEKDWAAEVEKINAEEEAEKQRNSGEEIDPDAEYEKIMRGKSSPVFQRMTSLKAPVVIAGTGAALGALGWIANQPWFHDFVLDTLDIPKTTDITDTSTKEVMEKMKTSYFEANPEMKNLGSVKAGGGGLTQQVSRIMGLDSGENLLGADASIEDLKNAALKVGGGDLDTGLKNIASLTQGRGNPGKAFEWMKTAINNPEDIGVKNIGQDGSLWNLFSGGTARGGDVAARLKFPGKDVFSVGVGNKLNQFVMNAALKTITKSVPKKITVKTLKKVGSAKAASTVALMTGAAPVLAGIGISTVAAGGTLALIRKRAKSASRMGTLNTLLQQLNLIDTPPAENVAPEPESESNVTITLYDEEGVNENLKRLYNHLFERTEIEITGLSGTEELEKTGGVAKFTVNSVSSDVPPKITKASQIPYVIQAIKEKLPDFDLTAPNVNVMIVDKRKKVKIPTAPQRSEIPPVAVEPAQIAKGDNAVVVFDPEGAKVFRILKKKTFQKYASDARRSGDKDAPEFADRHARYDSILAKLKADGVFVNSDGLESELAKISSGVDGDQYRISYTRTRGDKKRKSSTGGFTNAGPVKDISDIRKNIKGAPGAKRPKNQSKMTVIYLVGSNTIAALKAAGLKDDKAKSLVKNIIFRWAKSGNRPKIADLNIDDENIEKALKSASLAEAFAYQKNKIAIVDVNPKFFAKIIRECS